MEQRHRRRREPRAGARRRGKAAVALVGAAALAGGIAVPLSGIAGGSERHRHSVPVTFTAVASDIAVLGSPVCLDAADASQNCVRASAVGSYALEGDLSGSGVGIGTGVTANALRESLSLLRWTITGSPCGTGMLTIEADTLLPVTQPGEHAPEAVASSWRLVPEQGTGDFANVRGSGIFTGGSFRPDGSLASELAGKLRC
jgi:hypothetical protein